MLILTRNSSQGAPSEVEMQQQGHAGASWLALHGATPIPLPVQQLTHVAVMLRQRGPQSSTAFSPVAFSAMVTQQYFILGTLQIQATPSQGTFNRLVNISACLLLAFSCLP